MKNLIYTLLFVVVFVSCKQENASSKVKKENVLKAVENEKLYKGPPLLTLQKEVYDFGTVTEGEFVNYSFLFKNTGNSDLVISSAKPSCGCTVPTLPKEAIQPGESSEIKIEFDTRGKGGTLQDKSVILFTNTVNGKEKLRIKGRVLPKTK